MNLVKDVSRVGALAAGIVVVPFIAMQVTDAVVWTVGDFVIAWGLLFGAGLSYVLITRKPSTPTYKLAVGVAVGTALLLIWMNLAVGLIGSEDNPANMLYGGVLGIGIVGTLLARFQPQGMARALLAAAFVQALVPVIALIIWKPAVASKEEVMGVLGVLILNTLFVVLWGGSAWLFRRAAQAHPHSQSMP